MDLVNNLTDDQMALLGCAVALAVCGGLMWLSSLVNQSRLRDEPSKVATRHTIRLSEGTSGGSRLDASAESSASAEPNRKAA